MTCSATGLKAGAQGEGWGGIRSAKAYIGVFSLWMLFRFTS